MYFVTTFYQMWRYRLLMREHLQFRKRARKTCKHSEASSNQSHKKALEEARNFQRSYHLERRPFL